MDRLRRLQDSERVLEQQLQLLNSLKFSAAVMKEDEVEKKLKALMKEYRETLADIMLLLQTSTPDRFS